MKKNWFLTFFLSALYTVTVMRTNTQNLVISYAGNTINLNSQLLKPNQSVPERINKQKGYAGKFAAFTVWHCLPNIVAKWRHGAYENWAGKALKFNDASIKLINRMQLATAQLTNVQPTVLTYFARHEYLKRCKTKLPYIAFEEANDFADASVYGQCTTRAYAA